MAKNKEGKLIAKIIKHLDKRVKEVDITQRKALFLELENWAFSELCGIPQDIFLTALYATPATQDIQMLLAVDKAVKEAQNAFNKHKN